MMTLIANCNPYRANEGCGCLLVLVAIVVDDGRQQLILHRYNSVNYTFDFSARKIIVNVVVIATESVDLVLLQIFPSVHDAIVI